MVYSTRQFVLCITLCHFVLVFSVLLALRLPRFGKRELILVLFVRLFDLCLFGFVDFLFLLVSGKGCGLWLWHSLDFFLSFFLLLRTEMLTALLRLYSVLSHTNGGMTFEMQSGAKPFMNLYISTAFWNKRLSDNDNRLVSFISLSIETDLVRPVTFLAGSYCIRVGEGGVGWGSGGGKNSSLGYGFYYPRGLHWWANKNLSLSFRYIDLYQIK